jgi:hypothetical protein
MTVSAFNKVNLTAEGTYHQMGWKDYHDIGFTA